MRIQSLYSPNAAEALTRRERANTKVQQRVQLVLARLGDCYAFLDLGCGSGQYLHAIAARGVPRIVGIDESVDRLNEARRSCPTAELYQIRADHLLFPNECFDVALAAQVFHEIYLFGRPDELIRTLQEVRRVLRPGGRLLSLDHLDPGPGRVRMRFHNNFGYAHLQHFAKNFSFRQISVHSNDDGSIELSRRDLQDFVTKIWSFGTAMEDLEMRETHCPFGRSELTLWLRQTGFSLIEWLEFEPIVEDLHEHGIELQSGCSWARKFLLVAQR